MPAKANPPDSMHRTQNGTRGVMDVQKGIRGKSLVNQDGKCAVNG